MKGRTAHRLFLALALLAASVGLHAQTPVDNTRLKAIYEADQQARRKLPIDWTVVAEQDRAHRAEVRTLMQAGELRTAADYFHAAMVFQHGEELDDIRLAFSLAQISATLDPTRKQARWLTAAAWDRMLMSKNVPQWYGTQYYQPKPGAPTELYKIDEAVVSDAERGSMQVPSLQEARDLLKQINQ